MDVTSDKLSANKNLLASRWRAFSSGVPLLGWLLGALVAVLLEQIIGTPLARGMWLPKVPVLFGCVIMLKKPFLIPSAVAYMLLIYVLPIGLIARLSAVAMNRLAAKLLNTKIIVSVLVHILLLYSILHIWSGMSDYRLLVLKLMLVAVMLTLSLNVINGFMGEYGRVFLFAPGIHGPGRVCFFGLHGAVFYQ
jgi:branched-chain amino acid transport system permease protein